MAKKKRPKPDDSEMQPISDTMLTGEIPWSMEELGEVLLHAVKLHHTPRDDWDRREKRIDLVDDDGSVTRLRFNPDMFENQMMDYLIDRLRKQGLSQDVMMSHSWRYMEARGFLAQNAARLGAEGLVVKDPDDPAASLLSGGLVAALATAKYEGVKLQGPKREPQRTFHLERIIAEAKRLDAEED